MKYFINVSPVPSTGDNEIPLSDDIKCLNIVIKKKRGKTTAHIHQLTHDKRCALRSPDDNGLENGRGTFEMVMSTLSLCRGLFGVDSFTLEDASKFNCEVAEKHVQLRIHNLLVYGESYYERRFQAKPVYNSDIHDWEKVKHDLKGVVMSNYSELINQGVIDRIDEEYIEPLMRVVYQHQGRSTWKELFSSINQLKDSCVYFTNSALGVLFSVSGIKLPDFIDFSIDISDTLSSRYLKKHELIYS